VGVRWGAKNGQNQAENGVNLTPFVSIKTWFPDNVPCRWQMPCDKPFNSMESIMQNVKANQSLETLVLAAIDLYRKQVTNREQLAELAKQFKLADWRDFVAAILAREYGVEVKISQKFGWATFDKDTAAEQLLSRIFKLHPEQAKFAAKHTTQAKKESIKAPRKTYDAVEKLILDSGMTQPEFNALIAELKASIAFE